MLLLNKVLPLFVLPLGVGLSLLTWGVTRRRRAITVIGLLVLIVGSNPLVGNALIRSAEHHAERRVASAVQVADAIVVLSAGRTVPPSPVPTTEWGDANRYFGGLELFQAGRAPLLIFTGGPVFWEPDAPKEGAFLAEYARASGVPAAQIAVTGPVGNTADEAREVTRLLSARGLARPRVILVTSAFHMPRARQLFESEGLVVDSFPVDFWLSEGGRFTILDVLPSAAALVQTQTALREFYGRAFYWLQTRF